MSETIEELRLWPLGDRALLIELGHPDDETTTARVRAAAAHLLAQPPAGVLDVVPAVYTVAVHYDPKAVTLPADAVNAYVALGQQLRERLHGIETQSVTSVRGMEIAVCYGGAFGEDLEPIARSRGMSVEQAIALHCAPLYRVQMLGFAPGFPYLSGMDAKLITPRRDSPRVRVAAGTVAIGGDYTGIYPLALPGGWQLIGRTPMRLFDASHDPPSMLEPGDRVRFIAISEQEFHTRMAHG